MKKISNIFFTVIFSPILLLVGVLWCFVLLIKKSFQKKMFRNLNINIIDSLNGYDFEEVVAMIFKGKGFKVQLTPRSNDYGADLIATKKDKKIVVQTKLYYNNSVGNKAVQEIHTAKDYYNAHLGIVVTNWKYSKQAIEMAKKLNVLLISRDEFIKILESFKLKTKKKNDYLFSLINNFVSTNLLNTTTQV